MLVHYLPNLLFNFKLKVIYCSNLGSEKCITIYVICMYTNHCWSFAKIQVDVVNIFRIGESCCGDEDLSM